jgi:glycosyltransferase involved in cell wall biosynthesis
VIFIGREEHIFNLMNASDCILLPSIRDEDLPNVILEAMSLGKPIIASNLAGIPEEIDANSGVLVPPKDHRELAEGLMRILSDESFRTTLGKNARKRFHENFTHEKALNKYRTLYSGLLEDRVS